MSPRVQYYVVRPGPVTMLPSGGRSQAPARLVPLVAIDQLPDWVDIVGVPRELKPEEAATMLAISSDDNSFDTKVKIKDDDGDIDSNSNVFEVRIISQKNKATPGTVTSPKGKYKTATVVKEEEAASNETKDTEDTKDAKEAPVFVTAPSTPAGVTIAAPTTTPTMLAAREFLSKDKGANGGAPSEIDYDFLVAFGQSPSEHLLNSAAEAKTVTDAVKTKPTANGNNYTLVNDLINFGVTDSQPAMVQLDGAVDGTHLEKEAKQTGAKTDAKVSVTSTSASGDKKEKKEPTTPPPKPGSPLKKTVVAKLSWSPQKPRILTPGKPCRHWCRTGTCHYGVKCYYAHVMPKTPEGLKAVDLERLPIWWVKRNRKATDKVTSDGVRSGPRRADTTAGTVHKATSPVPPLFAPGPTRTTTNNPRPARSNSSTSTADGGPYLNEFPHYKEKMEVQQAKEEGTYYAVVAKKLAAPPTQTRHTRAKSSVAAMAVHHPYSGLAMQMSRPSRISWTTATATRSRAQSVATSGATKDSDSSENSLGGGNIKNGGNGTAPPVQDINNLINLVDL
ncbi:hypothetical protein Sste5346_001654 [Sporothrix stenoceras]|uniref:C3H1-type domain-containing protein n=1 Tax=Sporothrix stenoceras TaxID=5173 RepID=A0ABR3ZQ36_9PEZI